MIKYQTMCTLKKDSALHNISKILPKISDTNITWRTKNKKINISENPEQRTVSIKK